MNMVTKRRPGPAIAVFNYDSGKMEWHKTTFEPDTTGTKARLFHWGSDGKIWELFEVPNDEHALWKLRYMAWHWCAKCQPKQDLTY